MVHSRNFPFLSAHGWARVVKILLIVGAVVSGLSLISTGLSMLFPPFSEYDEVGDNPAGFAFMMFDLALALAGVLVYLSTVVTFLVWLYRAFGNIRSIGNLPEYSAGLAVGSFFIPLANLVLPYLAVRDLWRKSISEEEAAVSPNSTPIWFPLWWFFWLVSNFFGNLHLRLSFNENLELGTVRILGVFADGLSIIAAILAVVIIGEIDQRQEDSSSKLHLGKYALPPSPPSIGPSVELPEQDKSISPANG